MSDRVQEDREAAAITMRVVTHPAEMVKLDIRRTWELVGAEKRVAVLQENFSRAADLREAEMRLEGVFVRCAPLLDKLMASPVGDSVPVSKTYTYEDIVSKVEEIIDTAWPTIYHSSTSRNDAKRLIREALTHVFGGTDNGADR